MELQSEHNFGMMVTARARGRTGLKVLLRATNLDGEQLAGNLLELTDEIQIQVRPPVCNELTGAFRASHTCKKIVKKNNGTQKSINTFCLCLKGLTHR